jgi:adenosylhomocysteine nucleosidase
MDCLNMKNSCLIITALESELDSKKISSHCPIIFTGIGKINACLQTMKAIDQYRPQLIINFGTVGKINPKIQGLIEINKVLQRDMMTEPLAPRGEVPFSSQPNQYTSSFGSHTCGTGDSFVTSTDPWLIEHEIDVVDMELFAIAAVAHHHQIPWRSFKYITDDANEDSGKTWTELVHTGEALFLQKLSSLLN